MIICTPTSSDLTAIFRDDINILLLYLMIYLSYFTFRDHINIFYIFLLDLYSS